MNEVEESTASGSSLQQGNGAGKGRLAFAIKAGENLFGAAFFLQRKMEGVSD